jgi:Phage tail tube protein, TTP
MPDKQTHYGTKVFICVTPQPNNLNAAAFAGLTWVEIVSVGKSGDWGDEDNLLNYDTLGDAVSTQQKGVKKGGSPEIEVAVDEIDAGQNFIRTASGTSSNYAFKLLLPTGKNEYNRGVVSAPSIMDDGPNSFMTHKFKLGFNQSLIRV